MQLTKSVRLFLGCLILLTILENIVFFALGGSSLISFSPAKLARLLENLEQAPPSMQALFGVHFVMGMLAIAQVFGYTSFVIAARSMSVGRKILWSASLLLVGGITLPFAWYFLIWRSPTQFTSPA